MPQCNALRAPPSCHRASVLAALALTCAPLYAQAAPGTADISPPPAPADRVLPVTAWPDAPLPVSPPLAMSAEDEWHFTGGPYLWAAGLRGDVGHRSTGTAFVKSNFSDIAHDLDVAMMAMGEFRRGPWSVLVDVMFIDTTTHSRLPDGAPAGQLTLDDRTVSGFVGGGYSLWSTASSRVDAVGGARLWYSSTHLSLHGGDADGVSGSDRATWVDALAGVRGKVDLGTRTWIASWGLAGGGQARMDWDVAAMAGWDVWPGVSAVAGYRAMGVDYRHDGFVYDIVQQGPLLGISGRF